MLIDEFLFHRAISRYNACLAPSKRRLKKTQALRVRSRLSCDGGQCRALETDLDRRRLGFA